ncbi:DONSON (predicted) [Pycnogonum litorale]
MNSTTVSPATPWKKPAYVMKKIQKSKRKLVKVTERSEKLKSSNEDFVSIVNESACGAMNPFKCRKQESKKLKSESKNKVPEAKSMSSVFSSLFASNSVVFDTKTAEEPSKFLEEINASTMKCSVKDSNGKYSCSMMWQENLPVDWTLKTKARFISSKPFSWMGSLKTSEEASGITGFVRCLQKDSSQSGQCQLDTSVNAQFHQCCLIWKHPHLPWLKLYPRLGIRSSKLGGNASIFTGNSEIQDTLYHDWCDSFRSLYQLLRARQCPYFYLCTHTFTILFRATGICGVNDIHALLTPSTRGLRESLRQEAIQFTLPLKKQARNSSDFLTCENTLDGDPENSQFGFENEANEEQDDEDDDPMTWLQDMGLETTSFPGLNPNKIKLSDEKYKEIDNRPQSLIYVEGVEVQGLYNFLLNSKTCTQSSGPFAGIPPTLLSPVAFHGATLEPLKARQAWIKQGEKRYHAVQLTGPVLPHAVHNLCNLFASSQDGNFSATFGNLEQTMPFMMTGCMHPKPSAPNVFAKESLTDCGLTSKSLSRFCSAPGKNDVLQHLKVADGKFCCS